MKFQQFDLENKGQGCDNLDEILCHNFPISLVDMQTYAKNASKYSYFKQ